eukprot:6501346-Pyramimonas_sp.AAC.1
MVRMRPKAGRARVSRAAREARTRTFSTHTMNKQKCARRRGENDAFEKKTYAAPKRECNIERS